MTYPAGSDGLMPVPDEFSAQLDDFHFVVVESSYHLRRPQLGKQRQLLAQIDDPVNPQIPLTRISAPA